ncbi:His-Xaa-Ser system protein HxsD [Arachidicoccus rhizosphaerae]|uniref:His-Xaa-Ser system protein HxsD n=1 Tax=Arachidicoccus rhizosphaerae TaxID=551991 RepID=A0A1H3VKE5_9BACT|nr:His-Xaa-Ser system protein HxsD [Arachidicoccus rhizosphaerae]SDZ74628.1 His-Xaa-Ser system protein HxsD [Arachidicoccus rhizosphaerae]
MKTEINDQELSIYIDKSLYNTDVLYKCFYWYSTDYAIEIADDSEKQHLVKIKPVDKNFAEPLITKIKKDLIDFKLRDIVTKETKTIRELMIAKAFAYYDSDETPESEISDPVGFDPENMQE